MGQEEVFFETVTVIIGCLVAVAVIWQIAKALMRWQSCPVCRNATVRRDASECPRCGYTMLGWVTAGPPASAHDEILSSTDAIFAGLQGGTGPGKPAGGVIRVGDLSLTSTGLTFLQYGEKRLGLFEAMTDSLSKNKEEIGQAVAEAADRRCQLEGSSFDGRYRRARGSFYYRTESVWTIDIEPIEIFKVKIPLGHIAHFWYGGHRILEYNALAIVQLREIGGLCFWLAEADIVELQNSCRSFFRNHGENRRRNEDGRSTQP